MRRAGVRLGCATALATGIVPVAAPAQSLAPAGPSIVVGAPLPPQAIVPLPALAAALDTGAPAAVPPLPQGPPPGPPPRRRGFIRRLSDKFVGVPETFALPPLGHDVNENFGVMRMKADPHRFTLYRSDFLPGTTALSPGGATHLTQIAARWPGWLGPLMVEWTPDQPELALARRASVLAMLQGSGLKVIPERVVIGPPIYPGMRGAEAAINDSALLTRFGLAPINYSVTPVDNTTFDK